MLETNAMQNAGHSQTQHWVQQQLLAGSHLIQGYIYRHTRNPQEAADCYQEVIARVLEQARTSAINNPVAYAIRTARNLIINNPQVIHEDPELLEQVLCASLSPEERLNTEQRVAHILRILHAMPALRREVFIRRRVNGESRETIADALAISREAVKKHITRAMVDIQRELGHE